MQPWTPPFRNSPRRLIAQFSPGLLKNDPAVLLPHPATEDAVGVIRAHSQ